MALYMDEALRRGSVFVEIQLRTSDVAVTLKIRLFQNGSPFSHSNGKFLSHYKNIYLNSFANVI